MKNLIFILSLIFIFTSDVYAEIYHGIDIDSVYENGDWSSKNYIKSIIDDNTLLLQYEQELKNCSYTQNSMDCYDSIAEKSYIIFISKI